MSAHQFLRQNHAVPLSISFVSFVQIETFEQAAIVDEFSLGASRWKRTRLHETGNSAARHDSTAATD